MAGVMLERISGARKALASIETLGDALELRATAGALGTWARNARMGSRAVNEAISIAILAEYEAAEILRRLERGEPGRPEKGANVAAISAYARELKDARLSERTAQHWQQVYDAPRELVETLLADKADRVLLRGSEEAKEEITRRWLERALREQQPKDEQPVENIVTADLTILHGDYQQLLPAYAGTVDAIITDPPYVSEWFETEEHADPGFAATAAELLKPAGILVAMMGQWPLRRFMALLDQHLQYRWMGAYIAQGPRTSVNVSRVKSGWKPLLIYNRTDAAKHTWILDDVFTSDAPSKAHHHWGQSEAGFANIIDRLTKPGDLICDPFLGGGTASIVCRDLGRSFVGCDIDPQAIETTRARLSA